MVQFLLTHRETLVNKFIRQLLSTLLSITIAASSAPLAYAQSNTPSACPTGGVTFGFFNGVQTTPEQAESARDYLKATYGTKTPNGETIQYELFYNQTNGLADFVETFEQRLAEQNGLLAGKYELFFESIRGGGTLWSKIVASVSAANNLLTAINDSARAKAIADLLGLVSKFTNTPPTSLNYQEHRLRIDSAVLTGKKMLFLSHSQGNLFANVGPASPSKITPSLQNALTCRY